jgi:FkbM family methyltransferase
MKNIKKSLSVKKLLRSIKHNILFMRDFKIYPTKNSELLFQSNNYVTNFRYDTFFEKEPETLAWIDAMESGSTLWDIGANIGLYSIYFLRMNNGGRVVSFEPHPSNVMGLIENLQKNKLLGERVTVVPNPLYSENKVLNFSINSSVIGDSNHSVSSNSSNEFIKTNTITIDELLDIGLDVPNYLKVDVDGNELDIIKTADIILQSEKLKGVLIELDFNNMEESSAIIDKLNLFGFRERERFDTMGKFNKISSKKLFNVIFER